MDKTYFTIQIITMNAKNVNLGMSRVTKQSLFKTNEIFHI